MKKETLLAIAAAITAIANDLGTTEATASADSPTTGGDTPAKERKPRGRPPTNTTPPVEQTQEAAQEPEKTPEPEKPKLTAEELEANYQKLRGVIAPHVKAGKGPAVKGIIASYKPEGWDAGTEFTTKELAAFPEKHDAFAKEIEGLSY